MRSTSNRQLHIALAALLLATSVGQAAEKGCIELKNTAEVEQEYVDEHGHKAKRLVPAAKVVPGDQVIYTVTAKNVCDKSADDIVIANPIPDHMRYVPQSAVGTGTEIAYSLNSKPLNSSRCRTPMGLREPLARTSTAQSVGPSRTALRRARPPSCAIAPLSTDLKPYAWRSGKGCRVSFFSCLVCNTSSQGRSS